MFIKYTKRATEGNGVSYTALLYRIKKLKTPE